ncbi:MAG: folate family ECF transporter S component [Firmicutes bacterium]|nr:folate family ECF transporter S component [Bacillota bacterium]
MKWPTWKDARSFIRELPSKFPESAREMTHISSITGAGLVLALSIVLSYFLTFYVTPELRLGLAYLATAMLGLLYGPVTGGIVAGLGDIIKYFIKPSGAFFPGYTLTAFLGGFIYGLFFYRGKVTWTRCILSKTIINVFVNLGLNTLWSYILTGKGYIGLLVTRAWANLGLLPVQIILLYLVLKSVARIEPRIHRRPRAK